VASSEELLRGLADRISWRDALAVESGRHPLGSFTGRGAPGRIAAEFGGSSSAAWRAVRTTGRATANPNFSKTERFRNFKAAQAFRRLGPRIGAGKVHVQYRSARGRTAGRAPVTVPPVELLNPERIANYIEDGNYARAAEALEAQLLNAYGEAGGHDDLAGTLEITDYEGELYS
jgi:hypothetical protein